MGELVKSNEWPNKGFAADAQETRVDESCRWVDRKMHTNWVFLPSASAVPEIRGDLRPTAALKPAGRG